jgi:carboxylate-amine ligase
VIPDSFGRALTVGVEEEVMILDGETLELSPSVHVLVEELGGRELPGIVKTELHASVVELATGVCASAEEAVESLRALRRRAAAAAGRNGLALACAGSHPISRAVDQAIAPDERYRDFVEYAGTTARRQGVSGLHVHVGMPDREGGFRTLENVLPWLPVVLALSANSPYFGGEETGMMSTRAEVLALLPRRGAPPAFRSYDEWEAFVERLVATGLVKDYTSFWWDVRPHPRFGTLEIRAPDQPTSLERTDAFVRLLHRLCAWGLDAPPRAHDAAARGVYDQNRWAAARFGPHGRLIHPDRDEALPVARLAEELPVALDGLDPAWCEGDCQLELGRSDGLRAVCADLVARSLA